MGNSNSALDEKERCCDRGQNCVCPRDEDEEDSEFSKSQTLLQRLQALQLNEGDTDDRDNQSLLVGAKGMFENDTWKSFPEKTFVKVRDDHPDVGIVKGEGYSMHVIMTNEDRELVRHQTTIPTKNFNSIGNATTEALEQRFTEYFVPENVRELRNARRNNPALAAGVIAEETREREKWDAARNRILKNGNSAEGFSLACAKAMTMEYTVVRGSSNVKLHLPGLSDKNIPTTADSWGHFWAVHLTDCDAWMTQPGGVPPWRETFSHRKLGGAHPEAVDMFPALIGGPETAGLSTDEFVAGLQGFDFFRRRKQFTETRKVDVPAEVEAREAAAASQRRGDREPRNMRGFGWHMFRDHYKGSVFEAMHWFQKFHLLGEEQLSLVASHGDDPKKTRNESRKSLRVNMLTTVFRESTPFGTFKVHNNEQEITPAGRVEASDKIILMFEKQIGVVGEGAARTKTVKSKGQGERTNVVFLCYAARLNYLNRVLCAMRRRGDHELEQRLLREKLSVAYPGDDEKVAERLAEINEHLRFGREQCLSLLKDMLPDKFKVCRALTVVVSEDKSAPNNISYYTKEQSDVSSTEVVNPTVHFVTLMALTAASMGTPNLDFNLNIPDMSEVAALLFNQAPIDVSSLKDYLKHPTERTVDEDELLFDNFQNGAYQTLGANTQFGANNWVSPFAGDGGRKDPFATFTGVNDWLTFSSWRWDQKKAALKISERDRKLIKEFENLASASTVGNFGQPEYSNSLDYDLGLEDGQHYPRRVPIPAGRFLMTLRQIHKCSLLNVPSLGSTFGVCHFMSLSPSEYSPASHYYGEGYDNFTPVDLGKMSLSALMPAWHLLSGDLMERGEDLVNHTVITDADIGTEPHVTFLMGSPKRLELRTRSIDMNSYIPLRPMRNLEIGERAKYQILTDLGNVCSIYAAPLLSSPLAAYLSMPNKNLVLDYNDGARGTCKIIPLPETNDLSPMAFDLFTTLSSAIETRNSHSLRWGVKAAIVESMKQDPIENYGGDPYRSPNGWISFLRRGWVNYFSQHKYAAPISPLDGTDERLYSPHGLAALNVVEDPRVASLAEKVDQPTYPNFVFLEAEQMPEDHVIAVAAPAMEIAVADPADVLGGLGDVDGFELPGNNPFEDDGGDFQIGNDNRSRPPSVVPEPEDPRQVAPEPVARMIEAEQVQHNGLMNLALLAPLHHNSLLPAPVVVNNNGNGSGMAQLMAATAMDVQTDEERQKQHQNDLINSFIDDVSDTPDTGKILKGYRELLKGLPATQVQVEETERLMNNLIEASLNLKAEREKNRERNESTDEEETSGESSEDEVQGPPKPQAAPRGKGKGRERASTPTASSKRKPAQAKPAAAKRVKIAEPPAQQPSTSEGRPNRAPKKAGGK